MIATMTTTMMTGMSHSIFGYSLVTGADPPARSSSYVRAHPLPPCSHHSQSNDRAVRPVPPGRVHTGQVSEVAERRKRAAPRKEAESGAPARAAILKAATEEF